MFRNRTARRTRSALSFAAAAAVVGAFGRQLGMHFKDDPTGAGGGGGSDPFAALEGEFNKLRDEGTAVITAAAAANRDLTADEVTANTARFSRMETVKKLLDARAQFAAASFAGGNVQKPTDAPGRPAATPTNDVAKIDRAEFSKALCTWAESGVMASKFATITTSTQSGALLPKAVNAPIVPTAGSVLREALSLYGQTPMTSDTTADFSQPVIDAVSGGALSQTASSETDGTPSLAESFALNVTGYQSGAVWFSRQQLLAVGFDLLAYAQTDLAYGKDLKVDQAAFAAIVADANITQSVAAASISGISYDNLVDLNRKLPRKYDRMKVIILSKAAYTAAEKLVGDDGHPVLNMDPQNNQLLRFNGTPVLWTDDLEAFGANKVIGIVISLVGFKLRDVSFQELERYVHNPAKPGQLGLNLIGWHGWGYPVSAVAKLKCPAS